MSAGITILTPITVTPAMLVSSTVPESDAGTWAVGTTYALGERVMYNHKLYDSLIGSNLGNNPETATTAWVYVRPTNRWRMFDTVNSTQTAQATSMQYVLTPGVKVTHIAAINMTGVSSVRVQATSAVYEAVYDRTLTQTRALLAVGWWQWFFGPRQNTLQIALFDGLPPFPDLTITVTITGQTDLAVGTLLLGTAQSWGAGLQLGVQLGITDYSVKKTNEFGDVVLTQRGYSRSSKMSLRLPNAQLDAFHRAMVALRATPCLWICSDVYEVLTVYGYYQGFEPVINYAQWTDCALTIEGLT